MSCLNHVRYWLHWTDNACRRGANKATPPVRHLQALGIHWFAILLHLNPGHHANSGWRLNASTLPATGRKSSLMLSQQAPACPRAPNPAATAEAVEPTGPDSGLVRVRTRHVTAVQGLEQRGVSAGSGPERSVRASLRQRLCNPVDSFRDQRPADGRISQTDVVVVVPFVGKRVTAGFEEHAFGLDESAQDAGIRFVRQPEPDAASAIFRFYRRARKMAFERFMHDRTTILVDIRDLCHEPVVESP